MNVGSVGAVGMSAGSISPAAGAGTAGGAEVGAAGSIQGEDSAASSITNNVSITNNNTNMNVTQLSTQDFLSLHSGCQQPMSAEGIGGMSGAQEGGLDLQKLLEMMMVMMMLKMMQDMMQQSGTGLMGQGG